MLAAVRSAAVLGIDAYALIDGQESLPGPRPKMCPLNLNFGFGSGICVELDVRAVGVGVVLRTIELHLSGQIAVLLEVRFEARGRLV